MKISKKSIDESEILKEFFHGYFKKAAEVLSVLTDLDINISTSNMGFITVEDFTKYVENRYTDQYFASIIKLKSCLNINFVFLISYKDGLRLYNDVLSEESNECTEVSEDIISGVGEINNILSSILVNNLANLLEMDLHPETPLNAFDMIGAILEGVVHQEELMLGRIFHANTSLNEDNAHPYESRLYVMFGEGDLNKIVDILVSGRL